MELPEAMIVLRETLNSDEMYYYGWQANIAMAFIDNAPEEIRKDYEKLHAWANESAKNFLNNLIKY